MALEQINFLLAIAVMILQILTVAFLVLFLFRKRLPDLAGIVDFLSNYGLWIGFALSLAASLMTLFYSDVLGIAACIMCWWQRICLYPQVILFGVAAWYKERVVAPIASIIGSVIGGGIALYQHFLQIGITSAAPCDAIPGTDCSARFLFELGYMTFPLMSVSIFAALIVLMLFVYRRA
ncbi:disulfide bond formation protein B [Candidatus Parcubacteria bacterium]|nr:MAG: disulfide bond formation protein B [Candidatus Parcubacteria bacterium]